MGYVFYQVLVFKMPSKALIGVAVIYFYNKFLLIGLSR